ncbi:hypothetical protein [Hymenobacter properus]|uniref:Uncharacterized protein n=1 Tax=Hymenobacter properus TaxID=2791026 RepID=A0A931BQ04_9BACT|nr:hypothetical protein [Hymenobacter properus]MBF9143500.1 hypothetical protein [Hymenobacter properus]MBR7722313.1 hypothetical protein [Microvirga sp. SRT04]
MKSTIRLLRMLLAVAGLLFLGRLAVRFVRTGWEALSYSSFGYYDPTVFIVLGLLLLPAGLLLLRYVVKFMRKVGRRH